MRMSRVALVPVALLAVCALPFAAAAVTEQLERVLAGRPLQNVVADY